MAFVKLDVEMLNSTIWFDKPARDVFITALLMARPFETADPLPQYQVDSLTQTGWNVPPGEYGFLAASGIALVHRAMVDQREGMDALKRLGAPEAESKSPEHDGRRLVRVDGGYIVLNFRRYRDKDHTSASRQKRWRDRQREQEQTA